MILSLFAACADRAAEAPAPVMQKEDAYGLESGVGARGGGAAPGSPADEPMPMEEKAGRADGMMKRRPEGVAAAFGEAAPGLVDASTLGALAAIVGEQAPTPRAWFPESFLWQPLVEVPESGSVTVPVPVPDTLTTWRVLALGQTRAGAQGGAVTTFASTLPAYVDLVTPAFLWAGDVVALPVQAVSQQADPVSARLDVSANERAVGGGAVSLAAYGSRSETVTVKAERAGDLRLVARLGELDAVEKTVPVRPVGRPVDQARGGTLAGPRSFGLSGAGGDGSLTVTVFPGALGVARAELEAAPARGDDLGAAAYTYAVTGLAGPLAEEGSVRPDVLRATQLRAWQRIAKATRDPGVEAASTALVAVRLSPADTLAGRLAIRLAERLRAAQAADGLWGTAVGTSLDGALVQAARAVWALGPDNQANRLRATGAFERQRARLSSPYVAAWALTADVVDAASADALRKTVREALHAGADGAKTLRVDARRPDGSAVPEAEATALAILALPADDPARPDLAAGLLGLYDPAGGFGDGWTGLVALRALEAVFAGDVPREVAVRVEVDGAEVGRAVLDPAQPHAPVRIVAPGLAGAGERRVTVTSEPAVPGLAFTAVARSYLPWTQAAPAGLDLQVTRPALVAGVRAELGVAVAGPAGRELDVSIGVPAGVEPDAAALDEAVRGGRFVSWRAEEGRVTLRGVRTDGGAWSGTVPVTPTLSGTLLADVSRVWPAGQPSAVFERVPERWVVR